MTTELDQFKTFLFDQWAVCYPSLFGTMCLFFFIFLIIKNPGLVDFAWEACHLQVGIIIFLWYNGYNYTRNIIFFVLLLLWFIRLGGYILVTRIIPGEKDPRYEKLVEEAKNPLLFFFVQYQLQGFLISFCSIPLYFVFNKESSEYYLWSMIIGIIFIIIGLIGEAVADYQLYDYKERQKLARKPLLNDTNQNQSRDGEQIVVLQPQRKGIFAEGLWSKSRHPNLFFEQMIWIGFAFGGLNGWLSIIGFIGPIILHLIMRYLTVPISEQYMRDTRKEAYEEFCQRTNMFFIV